MRHPHLETHFGGDLNGLFDFFTGAYAHTMPAAVPADESKELIEQRIAGMECLASANSLTKVRQLAKNSLMFLH